MGLSNMMLDWHHFLPLFVVGFQIGPRIRVGGTLGKIGQGLKTGVGKIAQTGGKVVSLFNPALGAAISTAGDVLDTTDGRFNVGHAALNAAGQYGAGKLLGKIPGVSSLGSKVGGALQHIPGASQIGNMAHSVGNKLGGLPGGGIAGKIGGALKGVGGAIGGGLKDAFMPNGHLDFGRIIGAGGAVSDMIGANKQRKSAEAYNNSNIDARNALMKALLAPQNYNLPQINQG